MIYKKRTILNVGYYLYGSKVHILVVNFDKLLFLKRYKNINKLRNLEIKDMRIYDLICKLLKYRLQYLYNCVLKLKKSKKKG